MSEMRKRREENKQLQTELEPLLEKVKGQHIIQCCCDCRGNVGLVTDIYRCLEIVQKQLGNVVQEKDEADEACIECQLGRDSECSDCRDAFESLRSDLAEEKGRKKRWKKRALKLQRKYDLVKMEREDGRSKCPECGDASYLTEK